MTAKISSTVELAQARCFNHREREAVARCPSCVHFYCRECIAEHDDQIRCATCLAKLAKPAAKRRSRLAVSVRVACCILNLLLLWFCFYWAGETLLAIPSSFHEGTLWHAKWLDKP